MRCATIRRIFPGCRIGQNVDHEYTAIANEQTENYVRNASKSELIGDLEELFIPLPTPIVEHRKLVLHLHGTFPSSPPSCIKIPRPKILISLNIRDDE